MSLRHVLKTLRSGDDVRRLMVEHFNFEPSSGSVAQVLPPTLQEKIESAQVLARQNDFKVILCTLPKLLKGTERPVIEQFSTYHETAHHLLVFTDPENREFHFTNLRPAEKKDKETKIRRPFRRMVIGPDERLRTAEERLSMLKLEGTETAFEVQTKCDRAFDVEAVSRDFYRDFVSYYKAFRQIVMERNKLEQFDADIITQTVFNRFFFLYFIQKKGYLNEEPAFLFEYFQSMGRKNYYQHFVLPLFKKLSIPDFQYEGLENVPFLNGGLFEFSEHEEKVKIPNDAFEATFDGLFERYNFTVREDTEFEKEVAIDPEMMGTIFENLILGLESKEFQDILDPRRATGSYYTLKFIVSFMVKESLLNDLVANILDVRRSQLKELIFNLKTEGIQQGHLTAIRERLKDVKIVDPAVGSGAYAVGILLKIVEVIESIDGVIDPGRLDDPNYRYHLKRHIIENCIYGVDIQERAVALSHLRLWLSIIVDLQVENIKDIPPLPNLDFHILCGDSLISKVAGYSYEVEKNIPSDQKHIALIEQFRELKKKHETLPTQEQKEISKDRIAKAKTEILMWFLQELRKKEERNLAQIEGGYELFDEEKKQLKKQADLKASVLERIKQIDRHLVNIDALCGEFNWGLDFFDIMELRGGFDIVVANPPYGVKVSDQVRKEFGVQNKDSYGVFTVLGLRILKPGGTLCFIMSDTWQTIRTHKQLRDTLLRETDAQYLISLPPDVFAATVNTGVFTFIKRELKRAHFTDNADNWILAADFSPLKIRQPDGTWDSSDLEAAFEMLIEEDTFDETKDGYTICSDREMAIFAYRQKLIPRFSNHSFFIASPKLFGLMRDVGNIKNQIREEGEPPIYSVEFNGKELELVKFDCISETLGGIMSSENKRYIGLREGAVQSSQIYDVIPDELIVKRKLQEKEKKEGIRKNVSTPYYVYLDKGGIAVQNEVFSNYFSQTDYLIDWSEESVKELQERNALRNHHHYFKYGIVYSEAGIYTPTFRLSSGWIFAKASPCIFIDQTYGSNEFFLGVLCSKMARYLFKNFINHSVHTVMEDIGCFYYPINMKDKPIEILVRNIISKQKADSNYNYIIEEQIEIDKIVFGIYNLDAKDIGEVDNWYFRRYPKLARAIEEKLKAKGENKVEGCGK